MATSNALCITVLSCALSVDTEALGVASSMKASILATTGQRGRTSSHYNVHCRSILGHLPHMAPSTTPGFVIGLTLGISRVRMIVTTVRLTTSGHEVPTTTEGATPVGTLHLATLRTSRCSDAWDTPELLVLPKGLQSLHATL